MRLIDADALVNGYEVRKVTEYDESGCGIDYKAIPLEAIINAPSIDAIEVIHCKDCTLYGPSPYGHPTIGWCKMHGTHYKPEFFCGLAERREKG